MVEGDTRDNGEQGRIDNIGRIESAAHSRLKDNDVTFFSLEIFKTDRGDKLKLRGLIFHCVSKGLDVFGDLCKLIVGNVLAAELHTLVEDLYVGRGEKSRFVTCVAENRFKHRAEGALSVSSRNVNEFKTVLRVSELFAKCRDALKTRLGEGPADRVDIFKCFGIIHFITSYIF